ncbi:hypothetical protein BUALT_Bualt03G0218200 [Buddleja alternifolia]|uniref:WIT1/2 N-terminal helical bundle domain-containing protein n=1 Tax=Buddleja alternifolia TaxID=168488 RepID=A0AAV6Y6M6_9LAMI|nr:hypothetical protein BUALT_Bualt03G0218200 [Buddleja alternifolia]
MEGDGKKDEEEANIEGEFIKVEKEPTCVADEKPHVVERKPNDPETTRELLESQEKVNELEPELQRISSALKESDSINTHLKDELLLTKEQHQETAKKHEDLERNHKNLLEKVSEAEERYKLELKTLQEALLAQEVKHKELVNVKEAFDGLSLELETSRKKMEDLELNLRNSSDETQRFEELHKQSGLHAELETTKALEFEKLLELAKSSAKDMEDQMATLQNELKSLYEKISENEKVEEALKNATTELANVHGELELSKSQAYESKAKEDIASLQENVFMLEDAKLKLKEEVDAKGVVVEELLKSHEEKLKIMQEDLDKASKEKQVLEDSVADLTNNAVQMKELCNDLEAKLKQSDDNFLKADSLLSDALANSKELERKLKALEEIHTESGHAVTTANLKKLELEKTLQMLSIAAEEAKSQLRESETRSIAAEQRVVELEQL